MSTTTQPPDITAHLDAAERAGEALIAALCVAMAAIPEGDAFNGARYEIGKLIEHTKNAGCLSGARAALAEASRVKGPMVEVTVPSRIYGPSTARHEIAEITTHAIVLHNGARYSRKTGNRIKYVGGQRPPYITAEERARILALPRPPKATRA